MKSLPIRIPVIAKFTYLALILSVLYFLYSTQLSAEPQQNLNQATPTASQERTRGETKDIKADSQMDLSKTIDVIGTLVTTLAVILGGIGAYYKFFKGRTFHHRLQPEVSGKLILDGKVTCLLITMLLKNVGVSSVYFDNKGTRIDVYSYGAESYVPEPHLALWKLLDTFPIFTDHKWIESGETIKEELLVPISTERQVAFKVEMTVNTKKISFRSKAIIEWKTDEKKESK